MASTAPIRHTRNWIRDPIFILGCHKSGASLLRSLFDGHPQLYIFPNETHFFHLAGYGVDYPLRRTPARDMSHAEMVEKMVHDLQRQNASSDPRGRSHRGAAYDVQAFSESLLYESYDSTHDLYELFHGALVQALEGSWPSPRRVVGKSIENAEYASVLAAMYPSAHFIHIVRNPYATLTAMRRMKQNGRAYPYMGPAAASLESNSYYLFRNRKTIPNYHILRYEDLVREPERVMRKLTSEIHLDFSETLVRPTQNGRAWSTKALEDIAPDKLERWKADIHAYEMHLANAVARPVFAAKMYESENPERRAALPIRGESPQIYLANRILLRHAG